MNMPLFFLLIFQEFSWFFSKSSLKSLQFLSLFPQIPLVRKMSAFGTWFWVLCFHSRITASLIFIFPGFWSTWTTTSWNTTLTKTPSSCRLKRSGDLTSSLSPRSKIAEPLDFNQRSRVNIFPEFGVLGKTLITFSRSQPAAGSFWGSQWFCLTPLCLCSSQRRWERSWPYLHLKWASRDQQLNREHV